MLKQLVSIFLNFPCALCQRPASKIVCHYCEQQLKSYQLQNHRQLWQGNLPVFVWGKYDGTLKQAIASMKYNRLPEIGLIFGEWLGQSWLDLNVNFGPTIVVPIPLHVKKLKQRGFNQAEKIAEGFCQVTDYDLQPKVLKRVKQTQAMFGLNPNQRKVNIDSAFAVGKIPQLKGNKKSVLLIDDIYTTGATVQEAAQVLQQKGIKVIGVAVVATP